MNLEICVFSITDALLAIHAGADRIELCASYLEGGITTSCATIKKTLDIVDPEKIVVMIRPRGGNFIYDDNELEVMQEDIRICKQLGVKNVIFGITEKDGRLNRRQNKLLIDLASPMHCTLQRAFDLTPDPFEALDAAISCGFRRILTSGQQPSAFEGKELIKKLISRAGNKIDILPGAGINSVNAEALIIETGCNEIHTSAKMFVNENGKLRKGIYDLANQIKLDVNEVKALKEITGKF